MHYIKCFGLLLASSTMKKIDYIVIFNTNTTLVWGVFEISIFAQSSISVESFLPKFDFKVKSWNL